MSVDNDQQNSSITVDMVACRGSHNVANTKIVHPPPSRSPAHPTNLCTIQQTPPRVHTLALTLIWDLIRIKLALDIHVPRYITTNTTRRSHALRTCRVGGRVVRIAWSFIISFPHHRHPTPPFLPHRSKPRRLKPSSGARDNSRPASGDLSGRNSRDSRRPATLHGTGDQHVLCEIAGGVGDGVADICGYVGGDAVGGAPPGWVEGVGVHLFAAGGVDVAVDEVFCFLEKGVEVSKKERLCGEGEE